jgi:hypothetical protein
MTTAGLKDFRALSLPDEPFSAYCKTCWYPVYKLWCDTVHHGSGCHSEHATAADCPDAMGRAKFAADMQNPREKPPEFFPEIVRP